MLQPGGALGKEVLATMGGAADAAAALAERKALKRGRKLVAADGATASNETRGERKARKRARKLAAEGAAAEEAAAEEAARATRGKGDETARAGKGQLKHAKLAARTAVSSAVGPDAASSVVGSVVAPPRLADYKAARTARKQVRKAMVASGKSKKSWYSNREKAIVDTVLIEMLGSHGFTKQSPEFQNGLRRRTRGERSVLGSKFWARFSEAVLMEFSLQKLPHRSHMSIYKQVRASRV